MCCCTGQFEPAALWNLPGDYWVRGLPSGGIWFYRIKTVILSIPSMLQCNHFSTLLFSPCCHDLVSPTRSITTSCVLHLSSFDLKVTRQAHFAACRRGMAERWSWEVHQISTGTFWMPVAEPVGVSTVVIVSLNTSPVNKIKTTPVDHTDVCFCVPFNPCNSCPSLCPSLLHIRFSQLFLLPFRLLPVCGALYSVTHS